ncbi:MAG: hypothetical protein U9O89_04030 [Thermoproteota archaeon]|nr:hypothetical protein [Thermoproteota archaeon]
MFRIVKIEDKDRQNVIEQLKSDLLHNLFVIYDLLHEADKTSMCMAYDTDNSARGRLLVYRGSTNLMGRLDGEKKAARELLRLFPSQKMVLFCPPSLVKVVREKIPHANFYPEYQMYVAKGREQLVTPNLAQRVESKSASLLAELYSTGSPSTSFL